MKSLKVARYVLAILFGIATPGCERAPAPEKSASRPPKSFRLLTVGDPFAVPLERSKPELEKMLGRPISIEIVGYNDNYRLLMQMASDRYAPYDLVSFDVVWIGELAEKGVLLPLEESDVPPASALLDGTMDTCRYRGRPYGIPYQPHSELLWIRADWFEEKGMSFPKTTDELLAAARAFHLPEEQRYGIAWNAQRGQPLGQTMAHLFAAFGQRMLDENGLPAFNTERGVRAARYARALKDVGPPDILNMAWDQRVARFAAGAVAMTYGWGARALMVEEDPASVVRGRVRYGPPPHAPDAPPVVPLGVWAFGIPANVEDVAEARRALRLVTSKEAVALAVAQGHGAPAWLELMADPKWQKRFPVYRAMLELRQTHLLTAEMRPAVPEWSALCDILGTVYHDMLMDKLSPEEATAEAERRAKELFLSRR